jgi:hypothetical protein
MISATVSATPVKFRKSLSVSLSGHIAVAFCCRAPAHHAADLLALTGLLSISASGFVLATFGFFSSASVELKTALALGSWLAFQSQGGSGAGHGRSRPHRRSGEPGAEIAQLCAFYRRSHKIENFLPPATTHSPTGKQVTEASFSISSKASRRGSARPHP